MQIPYDKIRELDETDPLRASLATLSPLAMAMHLYPEIEAYKHTIHVDKALLALCDLRLYQSGPGPAPDVWVQLHEGESEWEKMGSGFAVAVSDRVRGHDAMRLLRPGVHPLGNVGLDDEVCVKIAISMPPRHGKSVLTTAVLPTWFLLRHPTNSVAVSTYNQDFADQWGKSTQDLYESKGHLLPLASDGMPLSPITTTLSHIQFRGGKDTGVIRFRGVGKSLTGGGIGLGVIDDPFKDHTDSGSPTERRSRARWYTSTFSTRATLNPGSPPPLEVHVATRWNKDDLIGAFAVGLDGVTPNPGWHVINLPALALADDPLGRKVGASLCPRLVPRAKILAARDADAPVFSALYQGQPTSEEGGMIAKTFTAPGGAMTYHHHWVDQASGNYRYQGKTYEATDLMYFVTMDTATSLKKRADWTVCSLWGCDAESKTLLLIDRKRDRVASETHSEFLSEFLSEFNRPIAFVGIEDKTFGTTLIGVMRRDHPEWVIVAIPSVGDKVTKALGYIEAVKKGKVLFPDPATTHWLDIWEEEHAEFPTGTHDDQVDTGAMAWTQAIKFVYAKPDTVEDKPSTVAVNMANRRQESGVPQHPLMELLQRTV